MEWFIHDVFELLAFLITLLPLFGPDPKRKFYGFIYVTPLSMY